MEPCEGGGYKDNQTGEMLSWLSQKDEAFFMTSMQRLCDRHRGGKWQTDWCNRRPLHDENRAYVIRYPNQVQTMLKKTWKLGNYGSGSAPTKRRSAGPPRRKRADASQEPDNKAKRQSSGRSRDPEHGGGKACRA